MWTDGASVVLTEEYDCTGGPGWGVTIGRGKTCSLTAIGGTEVVHNKDDRSNGCCSLDEEGV